METPNFYAIIPADVRYDKTIPANAKLLYGEITALCNQEGYCWASNGYFAELYGVSETSISKWISALAKAGYIRIESNKEKGNARLIYLKEVFNKSSRGIEEKLKTPIEEKLKHNNTRDNNKKINKKEILLEEYKNKYPEATEKVISILEDFISYRKQIGKPIKTLHGLIGYGKKLRELAEDGKDIYEAIKKMKDNEWQTVY